MSVRRDIHGQGLIPVFLKSFVVRVNRSDSADSGIVDENVETTQEVSGRRDQCLAVRAFPDVPGLASGAICSVHCLNLSGHDLKTFPIPIGQKDPCALISE
jgi:hypothetical protein